MDENASIAEPLLTQATHVWEIDSSKKICIMYYQSDYWKPMIPELDATKLTLRCANVKELCHIELWNSRKLY